MVCFVRFMLACLLEMTGAVMFTDTLSYRAPVVTSVVPSPLSTAGMTTTTFRLAGSGFGNAYTSVHAWIVPSFDLNATGVSTAWCSSGSASTGVFPDGSGAIGAPISVSTLAVVSDTLLTFSLPNWQTSTQNVLASAVSVVVDVMGQVADVPTVLLFEPPTVSSISFAMKPDGTHYFIIVQGTNFGAGSPVSGSGCAEDGGVVVSIDGVGCSTLAMVVVRGELLWLSVVSRLFVGVDDQFSCLHCFTQPHVRMLCTTTASSGVLEVHTISGKASVTYSSAELLQPPIITSVSPTQWDPVGVTRVTFVGERFGASTNASAIQMFSTFDGAVCAGAGALVCTLHSDSGE